MSSLSLHQQYREQQQQQQHHHHHHQHQNTPPVPPLPSQYNHHPYNQPPPPPLLSHKSSRQLRQQSKTLSRAPRRSGISTASTPNLNSLYSSHSLPRPKTPSRRRPSLAAIPDDNAAYVYDNQDPLIHQDPDCHDHNLYTPRTMGSVTPGRGSASNLAAGDVVDVPGDMSGVVRFVGSVAGRKGTFAGVELHPEYSVRGKNSGDVDGVSYFTTDEPGAGIFVPVTKAIKRETPPPSASSSHPLTPTGMSALRLASQNTTNHTPPTPSLPKFSQSVGPGRAPSPQGKRAPRTSLPRPDSPVRKLQLTPGPRPSIGGGSSIATPASKAPPRYGSPSISRFSSSVRGTAGDPNKPPRLDRKPSIAPRSASALGQISNSGLDDDEATRMNPRSKANGSIGSTSSMTFKRPPSRATHSPNEQEVERLRSQLEERDRQLKDQASTLAEMESSLVELTGLIEQTEGAAHPDDPDKDKNTSQLRALLREKNEKIALLTAEFDAHRADFRSTIDTLEMASTETQRVYDAKIKELEQDLHDAQDRTDDVDSVARQLKQLEELVQELEEGLEDARRGEAEARGEVEFLRGEVERTRAELRKEREKASAVINGGESIEDRSSMSKELEQKDDEIRGLKAIIHSLSRDSVPAGAESLERTPTQPSRNGRPDSIDNRLVKEKLEREVHELRSLVENKNAREEELEREVETLRRGSASTYRGSSMTTGSNERSSYRDSKGTVILARDPQSPGKSMHQRNQTLDSMPEMDNQSSATESSGLWCEICETGGHDILTCSNMFGSGQAEPSKNVEDTSAISTPKLGVPDDAPEDTKVRPLSPAKKPAPTEALSSDIKILPPPGDGPLPGKESGAVDPEKWCALCERDGHDSIDCPLEDAF